MGILALNFYTYRQQASSMEEFINFWERQYRDLNEHLYHTNIAPPLTPDKVRRLYVWKNGQKLAAKKMNSVERNFVNRLDELSVLPPTISAEEFLHRFALGGAIWRIFWLHCWQPDKFPIYDQHVHRAMIYIEEGRLEEIGIYKNDSRKVDVYLNRYLAFNKAFSRMEHRKVDSALLAFGQFLKRWSLPV